MQLGSDALDVSVSVQAALLHYLNLRVKVTPSMPMRMIVRRLKATPSMIMRVRRLCAGGVGRT